jgi:hypothetical protein
VNTHRLLNKTQQCGFTVLENPTKSSSRRKLGEMQWVADRSLYVLLDWCDYIEHGELLSEVQSME